ncbi:hypothetical protein DFH28DRAFT_1078219 [Melampsora americana]|nr:hypothetical protein DFH28DRAFT_1078219 [Melampsora americana]
MDTPEPPSPPISPSTRATGSNSATHSQQYISGIGLLLVVVGLWVSSSFLMSAMFRDESWNQPWLVTYICTSSFTFYLIKPAMSYLRSTKASAAMGGQSIKPSDEQQPLQASRGAYTPLREQPRARSVTRAFSTPERPLNTREIARLASSFVCLWFAANWSVNAALGYTSVSSTTILSSMSGFFTLGCGVMFGVEKFSLGRLIAVGASVIGVVLVSKSDHEMASAHGTAHNSQAVLGDALALSSAALYALYVLLMKVKVKDESRVDMQLFFGFVGAINLLCFWPMGFVLHYTGIEPFVLPDSRKLWLSVAINAMITFVSDYLYMLAMLKTSPLVVTLGLSLTLPVAVLGDLIKGSSLQFTALVGAALVLSSFVLLSMVEEHDH